MSEAGGPLTTRMVCVRNLDGEHVPIVAGSMRGRHGAGLFLRAGEGEVLPLGQHDAAQLIVNLRELIALVTSHNDGDGR